jgi:hypothetical protein
MHMKKIFLAGQKAGLTYAEIDAWIEMPSADSRTWRLKDSAPKQIVDIFPEYVDFFMNPENGE